MSLLIKNGRIITASEDYIADIFIEGETISAIGKNLSVETGYALSLHSKSEKQSWRYLRLILNL